MKTIEIGEGGDVPRPARLWSIPVDAEMIVTGAQPEIPGFWRRSRCFCLQFRRGGQGCRSDARSIRRYERKLGSAEELRNADVQKRIADEVRDLMRPIQGTLEGIVEELRMDQIVQTVAVTVADRTISIPQIVVLPKKQVTFTFEDFDLANLSAINMRPIADGSSSRICAPRPAFIWRDARDPREARPEDYLVRYLIERNEIDYDAHGMLLQARRAGR